MASSNLEPQATLTEELNLITTRAQTFTGANGAAIAIGERDVTEIVCRASSGSIAPPVGAHLRVEGSFTGICLQTGQALRCDDTETDNRVDPAVSRAVGIRSMVVVPIKEKETVIGVLGVFSGKANAFTDLHFAVLKTMASEINAAIQKAKKIAETSGAVTPPLGTPAPRPVVPAGPMTGKFTIPTRMTTPAATTPPPTVAAPPSTVARIPTPPPRIPTPPPTPIKVNTPPPTPVPTPTKLVAPPPPPPKPVPVAKTPTAPPPPPPRVPTPTAAAPAPALEKRDSGGYMIPPIKPADRKTETDLSFGTFDRMAEKEKKPFPVMPVGIGVGAVALVVILYFAFSGSSKPATTTNTTATTAATSTPSTAPATTTTTTAPPTTNTTNTPASPTPAATKSTPPPPPTKTETAKNQPPARSNPTPVTRGTGTVNAGNQNVEAPTINVATTAPTIPMGTITAPTAALRTSQATQAQLLSSVPPDYPAVARQFHASGDVVVDATVGTDGKVKTAKAVSGNPMLRDSAVNAVKQWRYKPATLNGSAVESSVQVTVKFSAQ